jgi:selT/selW/selH-like putative selenoprotein
LAAEIKDTFGVEAELIRDKGGIFDVHANDKLVFSKHAAGRFPESHEVLDALEKLSSAK